MYDVTVANPSRGCSIIFEGLPNAECPVDPLMVRAALLRRSCDGAAQTSSVVLILRVASATELMMLRRS